MRKNRSRIFWVTIDGVNHMVRDGSIVCDPSLNNRVWNKTKKESICPKCAENVELKQLSLFTK